uniref:UV radiation resistance-associated gene protein n=1 Tax=Noccaea caerulescens TaxID=107243 RepID=A0A1J3ENF2_NOCCA
MEKSCKCAVCHNSFRASICVACVNRGLNEYKVMLDSLKSRREITYLRLSGLLVTKEKEISQNCWMELQNEKLASLREKLQLERENLQQSKSTFRRLSHNLKERYDIIESTNVALEKSRVRQLENHYSDTIGNHYLVYIDLTSERLYKQALVMKQICKLFPLSRVTLEGHNKDGRSGQYDQICNALLPQGLNPLSVPAKELAASLGYMVQLLNLVVHKLAVPAVHNLGFGGSCSRIWQRDSYWNSHPSSPSDEYPLFVPSHDYYSFEGKSSWTGRDTTNFGVTSLKSDGSVEEDYHDLDVVDLSSASPQSVETFRNLQRGIANLKQSVAHLTAYGYSSLSLEVPSGSSTFETFGKLLATLSSLKEVQSALSLGLSSSNKQRHEPNKSVWNLNSSSSSTVLNSSHIQPTSWNNSYYNVPNRDRSYMLEFPDVRKERNSIGEWNLVEHPHSSNQPMMFNHPKNKKY